MDDTQESSRSSNSQDDAAVMSLAQQKATFSKEIFERMKKKKKLKSILRLSKGDAHYNIQRLHNRDLEAFIALHVEGGHIPLPPNGEYSDDVHRQIRAFLHYKLDGRYYRLGLIDKKGHFCSLFLDADGMEYYTVPPEERPDDRGFKQLDRPHFDLSANVKHLDRLEELLLMCCRSIPEELSELKDLQRLYFYNACGPEDEGDFPLSVLPALTRLTISETTTMAPNIGEWLSSSTLPALQRIEFYDSTIVTEFFAALRRNKCTRNISEVAIHCRDQRIHPLNDNVSVNDNAFAELLLETLPQVCPNLRDLSYWDKNKFILPEVVARLEEGRYHPALLSTICLNLRSLRLGTPYSFSVPPIRISRDNNKRMFTILKWFKRLDRVQLGLCKQINEEVPFDQDIDCLLAMNHGGGRILLPQTQVRFQTEISGAGENSDVIGPPPVQSKSQSIATSLWPYILQRAGKSSGQWHEDEDVILQKGAVRRPADPTVIFRLLRPNSDDLLVGPALEGVLNRNHSTKGKMKESRMDESPSGALGHDRYRARTARGSCVSMLTNFLKWLVAPGYTH